jgi:hypothetical protein
MTQTTPKRARRMTLSSVTRGVQRDAPMKLLIYGPGGIGKTTLAAQSFAPIFLPTEDGSLQLDVARFPRAETIGDVYDGLLELSENCEGFGTLVVDTISGAESLLLSDLCARNGWASIASPGFGNGEKAALDEWRKLLAALERFQATTNMHIILLGHSAVKPFNDPNPAVGRYDRYSLGIDQNAAALLHNWVDAALFANYETVKKNVKDRQAIMSGLRFLHTERANGFEAKNRYSLPPKLPLDWAALSAAIVAGMPADTAALLRDIHAMADSIDATTRAAVLESIERDSSPRELARVHNKLSAMIETKGETK